MSKFENIVKKSSSFLDGIAGLCIVVTMVIVVVNIILSVAFNSPIQGVYEYAGYLTAAIIGLSLACCALQKAHISVGIIMERFPKKVQLLIDTILGIIIIIFLAFTSYQIFCYGLSKIQSGEVSTTAHIPYYPFIFTVSFGLFVLCLVELYKILKGAMKK